MSEWTPRPRDESVRQGRGYCVKAPESNPSLDWHMNNYLYGRGIPPRLARHNYWYPSSKAGDSFPRVVIPGTSTVRFNKFWTARYIGHDNSVKRYQCPSFDRGDAFVVTYPIRPSDSNKVAVVEGPLDALSASQEGVVGAALLGIAPGEEVLKHVRDRFMDNDLFLIADADAVDKMVQVMNTLVRIGFRGGLRVITTHPYKDLNGCPIDVRLELLGG